MTSGNGADVPAAIRALREAGLSVREVASDLDLHVSTIYRWQSGARTPRPANFAALVEHVDAKYGQAIHGRVLASAVHLSAAYEALRTDADRSSREATAQRLAADQAAAEQRRQAAEAEKHADVRELANRQRPGQHDLIAAAVAAADSQPEPYVPMVAQLEDPFDAFTPDREMALVEGIFG